MADLLRQILRVDGLIARFCQIIQPFTRVAIITERFIEELTIGFFFQMWQQGGEGGFNVANQRHIHFAVRADAGGVDINLDNFSVRRIERAIRELGAE